VKNAVSSGVTLLLLTGLFSFPALAQNLIIVRPGQEFISRGLEPIGKEKFSRGRLVFQFGSERARRPAHDPYHTLVVYPHPYSNRQPFTGKDASGSLYFGGYPVVPAGSLKVKIEPFDAAVFVDGYPVKIDAASGSSEPVGYPVGQHKVEARKSGFTPYEGEVEIKQASEVHIDIKLAQ
jgi:PEGA domain